MEIRTIMNNFEVFNEYIFAFSDHIFALTDDKLEGDCDEAIEAQLASFGF